MFDFGWSELLLIAVVALIVVGPKELPVLLRTLGRYVGIVRAQALAFRAQIDDAIKDTELESLRDEMTDLRDEVKGAIREGKQGVVRELEDTKSEMGAVGSDVAGMGKPTASADKPATAAKGVDRARGNGDGDGNGNGKSALNDEGEA